MASQKLEGEYRTVSLFIDNAKTYIQLGTGALVLSVSFAEGISGVSAKLPSQRYLWIPWLCWLTSIIAGVTYQYCVAKYLEHLEIEEGNLKLSRATPFAMLSPWVTNPYQLYGIMMAAFYLGTVWFGVAAILRIAYS